MIARSPLCELHAVCQVLKPVQLQDGETMASPSVRCVTAAANCPIVKTAKVM
jgi:hypothetical protein